MLPQQAHTGIQVRLHCIGGCADLHCAAATWRSTVPACLPAMPDTPDMQDLHTSGTRAPSAAAAACTAASACTAAATPAAASRLRRGAGSAGAATATGAGAARRGAPAPVAGFLAAGPAVPGLSPAAAGGPCRFIADACRLCLRSSSPARNPSGFSSSLMSCTAQYSTAWPGESHEAKKQQRTKAQCRHSSRHCVLQQWAVYGALHLGLHPAHPATTPSYHLSTMCPAGVSPKPSTSHPHVSTAA